MSMKRIVSVLTFLSLPVLAFSQAKTPALEESFAALSNSFDQSEMGAPGSLAEPVQPEDLASRRPQDARNPDSKTTARESKASATPEELRKQLAHYRARAKEQSKWLTITGSMATVGTSLLLFHSDRVAEGFGYGLSGLSILAGLYLLREAVKKEEPLKGILGAGSILLGIAGFGEALVLGIIATVVSFVVGLLGSAYFGFNYTNAQSKIKEIESQLSEAPGEKV
ncbi:MAG: hypothetical protein HY401_00475 [Elusimicrobia bacterium]|nr:hypothetical protein [Elusimicrobiota bacterium]